MPSCGNLDELGQFSLTDGGDRARGTGCAGTGDRYRGPVNGGQLQGGPQTFGVPPLCARVQYFH